ncbi:hypothetical protein EKO27_g3417 [Xylaria grammica]|uniref:Uncharacterized protein n=1 Tax=Xylaria grammica TaxID=363999 RepID=A0A439DBE9_9PEZI|nr:hypothetical protein EKO27_g3417 [Xylaria grammica]
MSSSAMTTYEQFAKFSNDSAGLERIFRLLQSWVQILRAYSSTFHTLGQSGHLLWGAGTWSAFPTNSTLLALQQRLDAARRYVRVFRFLSAFQHAQRALTHHEHIAVPQRPNNPTATPNKDGKAEGSPSTSSSLAQPRARTPEEWLDILGRMFNGMYLLTETSTIIDYMQIDGLQVWGADRYLAVNVEAQRFWFLTLLCGVLSGLLKIWRLLAANEKGASRGRSKTLANLIKGVVTNAADIVLPGVIVGWLDVSPGIVALVMCATTLSTSLDIWERCGRDVSG